MGSMCALLEVTEQGYVLATPTTLPTSVFIAARTSLYSVCQRLSQIPQLSQYMRLCNFSSPIDFITPRPVLVYDFDQSILY